MAKPESDFQKLLSESPAAPDADTVTVVGVLARTADARRFVLTLPGGRSETLDVDAVKSAKKVAGAIGQSLVELELDAKRVPESLLSYKSGPDYPVGGVHYGTHASYDLGGKNPAIEIGGEPAAGRAPFVAALPHQAHPATFAALASFGNRTYFTAYDWTTDHHTVMKAWADPQ